MKALGYSGAEAQLLSAYAYIPASVLVVIVAFLADKLRTRGPIALALLPLAIVGCKRGFHDFLNTGVTLFFGVRLTDLLIFHFLKPLRLIVDHCKGY